MRAEQLPQLQALLDQILPANAFYRRKLGDRLQLQHPDELATRIPFTTKAELAADQQQHPPFGSCLTYPVETYTRLCQTSATTGVPMRWLDTDEGWAWMLRNWQRVYDAAQVQAADRCFFAFSFGPFLGFWTAFEAAVQRGCLCVPGGGMRSDARLQQIADLQVTVLCCTPTYAIHLGQLAAAGGHQVESVRRIIVAGEPGGSIPATRRRIETLWPAARLIDHHGMTEVGPVSYQCPDQPCSLRIIGDAYLAEIIDPQSGDPVDPGNPGELVLTTLGRVGSPLLRYRTGDLVRLETVAGSPDPRLIGGILSRVDDMVIIRGVNVYPAAVEDVVRGFPDIAEYAVRLSGGGELAEISLQLEIAADRDAQAVAERVGAALRRTFALRFAIETVPPGSLPRFELKAKRWLHLTAKD